MKHLYLSLIMSCILTTVRAAENTLQESSYQQRKKLAFLIDYTLLQKKKKEPFLSPSAWTELATMHRLLTPLETKRRAISSEDELRQETQETSLCIQKALNFYDNQHHPETQPETDCLRLIADNNRLLKELEEKTHTLGTLKKKQAISALEKRIQESSLYKTAARISPYALATSYYLVTTSKLFQQTKQKITSSIQPIETVSVGSLLKISEKPFELAPLGLLMPIIKKDLSALSNELTECRKWLLASLKGDTYLRPAPTKKSPFAFNDIWNNRYALKEIQPLIDYLENPLMFGITRSEPSRGYLFTGQKDSAKKMAYALAGEITKKRAAQKPGHLFCGVTEIHASQLLQKSCKEICKEIALATPCVLIIDELEWLFEPRKNSDAALSDLVTTLSSTLKPGAQDHLIIIGITDAPEKIPSIITHEGRLSTTLHFSLPSIAERHNWFIQQLHAYTTLGKTFDYNYLAGTTAGCSETQLSAILSHALTSATAAQETLAQEHIEKALDTQIRGIIENEEMVDFAQRRLRAASLAGKICASLLTQPDMHIAKATIYSLRTAGNTLTPGALFTYTTHSENDLSSSDSTFKKLLIEQVGIETQRELCSASPEIDATIYNALYQITTKGVNGALCPQKNLELLREKNHTAYTSLQEQARTIITNNKQMITTIAHALEEKTTLTAQEIHKCIG